MFENSQPKVDESKEIVDESCDSLNLLTDSGFSPSEEGDDSVDWLEQLKE